MQRFPGRVATLLTASVVGMLLAADVGAALSVQHRGETARSADVPTVRAAPTTTVTVPGPGQTHVTGRVTLLTADDAVAAPLGLPVTITVPQRGRGDVTIVGITVGGQPEQIVWLAGQPLPLSGTGSIDLGPASVTADAGGIVWHLDHGQRVLTPGHYTAGAPVAVGQGGLADARDSVSFDAGAGAGFVSTGDAQIRLAAVPLALSGPGRVHLSGALTVQRGTDPARAATTITFGPGPFVVSLRPDGPSFTVEGRLEGNVTVA